MYSEKQKTRKKEDDITAIFKIIAMSYVYWTTVVGDYINTMKTTFDLNFLFISSFQTALIYINMETKRCLKLTASRRLLASLKKAC